MDKRKLYLDRNYRSITMNSVDKVVSVHSEYSTQGEVAYYVIGDDADEKFLDGLGYLRPSSSLPGASKSPEEREAERPEPARDPEEYVQTGTTPSEFFCKDHEDVHVRGDVEYYTCLDKFLSGQWSTQASPPSESAPEEGAAETLEERIKETEDLQDQADKAAQEQQEEAPETVEDTRTHSLSIVQLRGLIGSIEDVDELAGLVAGERQHPEYEGGRKGALNVLQEQIDSVSSPA